MWMLLKRFLEKKIRVEDIFGCLKRLRIQIKTCLFLKTSNKANLSKNSLKSESKFMKLRTQLPNLKKSRWNWKKIKNRNASRYKLIDNQMSLICLAKFIKN